MASKPPDWKGLTVQFQNQAPKPSAPPLLMWLKWMGIGIAALMAARLLAELI